MKRETLQKILKFLILNLTTMEFQGLENVPTEGGILITTNHLSQVDTGILFITPTRKDITAVITDKYKKQPLINFLAKTAGGIWIDRDRADFSAFKASIEWLRKGGALGIAPEGTRSRNGQLQEGKPGAVLLAVRAEVPIVPVGIWGSEDAFTKIFQFKRPKMFCRFGKPYRLPPIDRNNREQSLLQATEEVMCRIAALLPPKYHGFYTGHGRLTRIVSGCY